MYRLFFLITFFIFCTGCTQTPLVLDKEKQNDTPTKQYQITAPWDTHLFDTFYTTALSSVVVHDDVRGGIVPHHLLAGKYIATFFETIKKQKPSIVVIIGPCIFRR